jgi:hypothetical protein
MYILKVYEEEIKLRDEERSIYDDSISTLQAKFDEIYSDKVKLTTERKALNSST